MQWTPSGNDGFSSARRAQVCVPVVANGRFGYREVNVADQQSDHGSLLNWMQRALGVRAQCPEFGHGSWEPLDTGSRALMALRSRADERETVDVHILAGESQRLALASGGRRRLVEVFANRRYGDSPAGAVDLGAYGYRWLRAGNRVS